MLRFIVGLGLALGALVGAIVLEGGDLLAFLMASGFLISFLVPLFSVLAVWTWGDARRAWGHAFRGDPGQVEGSVALWKFAEAVCYLAGVLASLAGGILILGNLTPDPARWGRSLGALLVAPLYGGVFGLVCRILKARVEHLHR